MLPFPFSRSYVLLSVREQADDAARKYRVNDQPDRRERDDAVDNNGAYAPILHKDRGHEVEIKDTV